MNKIQMKILLLTVFMMCVGVAFGTTDHDTDHKTDGQVSTGVSYTNIDGYAGKVAEYSVGDLGSANGFLPVVKAHASFLSWDLYLEVEGAHSGNSADQRYRLFFDAARVFKTEFTLNRFLHRLDNDPLTNIDTSQGVIFAIGDNRSPGHDYRVVYTDMRSVSEIAIPDADWLKFRLEYRRETRDGGRQGYQMNHCLSCHLVSVPHSVDETSDEVRGSVLVDTGTFGVGYTYQYKQFKVEQPFLEMTYDRAIHPGTLLDIFTNRTLYDARDGVLPVDGTPSSHKYSHTYKAHYNVNDRTRLAGAAVYSKVENEYTGLGLTGRYYTGRFSTLLRRNITLTAKVRYSNIDNETTFVDLNERASVAGPQAGLTFSEAYPSFGPVDFYRFSALSRNDTDVDVDATVPLQRHRLAFGYSYRKIDRDYFDVKATEKHRIDVNFRTNPRLAFSGRIHYQLELVDNPFVNYGAAIAPALQPFPTVPESPFPGTQYFEVYRARQATLSNQPNLSHNIQLNGNWKPASNVGVNLSYNYRFQKNDDLNYSDWTQNLHILGANVWFAPQEKVTLAAGVNYNHYKTETLFTSPVWNG